MPRTQKIPEILVEGDEQTKKSKYCKQVEYDKKRKQEDPEYKAKKNELVRKRNAERYKTDPEFKAKIILAAKVRNQKIRDFYKAVTSQTTNDEFKELCDRINFMNKTQ